MHATPTDPRDSKTRAGLAASAGRRRDGPRVDRIVILRIGAAVLALALLALVVRAAMIAFGSPERTERRIERAVERSIDGAPRPGE